MKRLKFKNTFVLGAVIALSALIGYKAPAAGKQLAFAPFGLVAGLKKKGIQLDADQEAFVVAFENEANEAFKGLKDGLVTPESMQDKLDEMASKMPQGLSAEQQKQFADTVEAVRKQAIELEQLKSLGAAGGERKDMSLRGQVKAWIDANKEQISQIKANVPNVQLNPIKLDLKAAATMTVASNTNQPNQIVPAVEIVPGVIDLVRNQPFILQYANTSRTQRAVIAWVNKYNKQGNAAFIGEGVLKPLASFELQVEQSTAKKVAERMKASTEILDDVDEMTALIENELRYEVNMAVDAALLSGTASATVPAGITTFASAYTLTTVKTTNNPNNFDAIRAAIAQLASLNFLTSIVAFVNPIDAANMDLTKTDQGAYVNFPNYISPDGRVISGVRVVETNQIPVGHLLIADMSKFFVRIYQDFTIAWGWENDDFSKNLVTVIGEMRLHAYHSANHTGAFIYDTFANIKTAVTAA